MYDHACVNAWTSPAKTAKRRDWLHIERKGRLFPVLELRHSFFLPFLCDLRDTWQMCCSAAWWVELSYCAPPSFLLLSGCNPSEIDKPIAGTTELRQAEKNDYVHGGKGTVNSCQDNKQTTVHPCKKKEGQCERRGGCIQLQIEATLCKINCRQLTLKVIKPWSICVGLCYPQTKLTNGLQLYYYFPTAAYCEPSMDVIDCDHCCMGLPWLNPS